MLDLKNATDKIFDRVHRTGEEIKNDLPNWIERVVSENAWKQSADPATGKPFSDIGQWLIANYPYGPGMGHGRYAIKYDELIALCDDRPMLKGLLVKHRPKRPNGTHKRKEDAFDNIKSKPKTGTSRLYIEERLQRDHKKIWNDYLHGKYKSARQAGIAAGFIKDGHDPFIRIKSSWKRLTKKQRSQFLEWIKEE